MPSDAEIESRFHADVPVEGGLLRLGHLRDFLEALEGLPDNALITVQNDGLFYEEP